MGPSTRITVDPSADSRVQRDAERWAARVRVVAGIPPEVARGGPAPDAIHISASADGESLGEEGYRLEVNAESATITAAAPPGAFYALQTLRQLLPAAIENGERSDAVGRDPRRRPAATRDRDVLAWNRRRYRGRTRRPRRHHDAQQPPVLRLLSGRSGEDEPLAIGGFLPLDTVYAYEPIPEALNAEDARHVLGAQGNVWTEYMKTPEHVQYMVFPRLLALSEVVWSPRDRRDWASFRARLPAALARLDALGVNYRAPFADARPR